MQNSDLHPRSHESEFLGMGPGIPFFCFVCFGSTRVLTQGLMLTTQVLYDSSHILPALFCFSYFTDKVL
jgi:hypothetical protein